MKPLLLFFLVITQAAFSQTLTLEKVTEAARRNYPLIRQKHLVQQTKDITIENLNKAYWPQVTFNGQATYQSDVTQVKIPVPGVIIEPLSKDQYRIVADVNQTIWDGGLVKQQKNISSQQAAIEEQKIEVELYKLTERITQMYLAILFLDEQLVQAALIQKDLETGRKKVEAQVLNGVAYQSNLNLLKAELLKVEQRIVELQSTRTGLLDVLSLFTGDTYPVDIRLEKPVLANTPLSNTIQRPELQLFQRQHQLVNVQKNIINARNLPKTSFFFQGGYGRPGLNMLENQFSAFYVTGIRFNWAIGNFYTSAKEKELLGINKKMIDLQQEVFLLNTNSQLKQQLAEINKLKQLIVKDQEIIALRFKINEAANAQLENGVITASDYLREVNAEDQARQTLILHQVQLLQAQINYQTILGK